MTRLATMRAFVALNIDVGMVRHIVETARTLRSHPLAPEARWVAAPKIHLTLKFFGAIDVGLAPAIVDVLRPLATDRPAPRVQLVGVGAFPSPESARVIFVDVGDLTGEVRRLAATLEDRTEELGFAREERPFRPHVTIARTSKELDLRPWLASGAPTAHARASGALGEALLTELVLYRSDAARAGAEYEAIARFPFAFGRVPRRSERPARPPSRRPPPPAPAASPPPPPESAGLRPSILPPDVEAALPSEDEWD